MKKTFAIAILSTLALGSVAAAHGRVPGMRMQKLDTDGNATISLDEFKTGVAANLAHFDANADGRVEKTEITEHKARTAKKHEARRAAKAPALAKQRAERAEQKKAEREALMTKGFDRIDQNRDGALDTTEIEGHATARFSALDANTDGSLDAVEMRAGRATGGKPHGGKDRVRGKSGKVAGSGG